MAKQDIQARIARNRLGDAHVLGLAASAQGLLKDKIGVVLALLALYLIWGSTYLGIRVALLGGFPPFLMAGTRFLIAGGIMYLFLRLRGVPNPSLAQWRSAGLVGGLLLVGGNGGVTYAEQWVPSGLAALGVATTPIWAALFAGLWGRWPTRFEWVGLVLGFVGVVLLNLEGDLQANPLGAAALLVATACWSFGSIWSRHLTMPTGLMSAAAQMLLAGAMLLVLSLFQREELNRVPSSDALWAFAYLIVVGAIVAYSAYIYLLGRVRPALATSYAYVNPVVAVGLGMALLGESITGFGLAATLVILMGVGLVMLGRKRDA